MVDFVTDSSIKVTGARKERPPTQAVIISLSSRLLYSRRCKRVPVSGPHDHRNCCLSESWTDLRSDSFRKECVWLGGNCRPTSCVNILSVPSNLSLAASRFIGASLPFQHCHLAHLLLPRLLYPPLSLFPFIYILSSSEPACNHPAAISTPTTVFLSPSPGRQAGRLPSWGPRWCSGESASSGSLSLQDGRTALLWPIWPRPVLAPVCDYGPAGGWQGSHSERTVPVHSRLGDCGGTHSHTDVWLSCSSLSDH